MKTALKYIVIALVGVILFFLAHRAALPERPAGGIGGEAFLLILPLMWWIVESTIKDLLGEFKRMQREINEERAAESGGEDSTENGQKN